MKPTECQGFHSRLEEILQSKGKLALPNIKEIAEPQEGLNLINRASASVKNTAATPYELRIQNFDPPKPSGQTHELAYYPKIFLNGKGMGGNFDGSGVVLASPRNDGVARVYSFHMCEHDWDESGANHMRGWHPARCKKCGFDASIDSGD